MADGRRFDVFLSHSHADRAAVVVVAQRLRDEAGLRPFLDRWHLVPGAAWQAALAHALNTSATAAVFIGPTGVAPWHNEELQAALNRAVAGDDEFRVIPVLLPGVDGPQLPTFLAQRTWVDFRPGLDDDEALQRLAAAVRGEAIDDGGYELPDDPMPYRGLLRFDAIDARFFFGRSREIEELVERVSVRPFVAVEGASGSGKSSVVRAGLIPELAAGAITGSERWIPLVCTPASDPFRSLAQQVARLADGSARLSLVDELTARFSGRVDGLRTAIGSLVADDPRPVLLVVDQFEELFTLCTSDDPRQCRRTAETFVGLLADAVDDPASNVRVVVTLRADFLGSSLQLPRLKELLADPVLLGPLDDTALREVVVGPAQEVGAFLEKGVVAAILRDVHDQHGALPLLQHALLELWHRRRGPWLTLDAYNDIGGVGGALARRADATYASLSPREQHLARMVLLRLVTLGEGVADTRRRVSRDEVYPADASRRTVDAVVHTLSATQARLVVADEDTVEITHEALLRGWDRLRGWLETDREAQRVHRRLTAAAAEWAGPLNRDPGALYRGAPLAQANEWAADHADELNAIEAEFLDASREASAEELQRLRRRLYAAVGALAVMAVLAVVAWTQSRQAADATSKAEDNAARALAQQAVALAPQRPALALAIAAEAVERRDPRQVTDALQEVYSAYLQADWRTTAVLPGSMEGSDLLFSANGDHIAIRDSDTVAIFDTFNGSEVATLNHGRRYVHDMKWSSDGNTVTTVTSEDLVVWNIEIEKDVDLRQDADTTIRAGRGRQILEGSVVRFAPDGDRLLIASNVEKDPIPGFRIGPATEYVIVWDVNAGKTVATLRDVWRGTRTIQDVAWSPDGEHVAALSDQTKVTVWDADTGQEDGSGAEHPAEVQDLVWSPDGRYFATATEHSVRIWNVDSGEKSRALSVRRGTILDVAFAPDSDRIALASSDGTVELWDVSSGDEDITLSGHEKAVNSVAFASDGGVIVTGSADATVRLWSADTGEELTAITGHADPVTSVTLSIDGDVMATTSDDSNARMRTLRAPDARGEPIVLVTSQDRRVGAVEWTHDGERVATVSSEAVTIWDATTGQEETVLSEHSGAVFSAAFTPDDNHVVITTVESTSTRDDDDYLTSVTINGGTAALWNTRTGRRHTSFTEKAASDAAFSPDGKRIAIAALTSGKHETVRDVRRVLAPHQETVVDVRIPGEVTVWDVQDGNELFTLTNDDGAGMYAQFVTWSPDGDRIATASDDVVRIWNADSGDEIGMLRHEVDVNDADFSPSGDRIATASDGGVTIWSMPDGDKLTTISNPSGTVESVAFASDGDYIAVAATVGDGENRTITIWDTTTGDHVMALADLTDSIFDVEFAPAGDRIAVASTDGRAVLRPIVLPAHACDLIAAAVTASELDAALAGDKAQACTDLE